MQHYYHRKPVRHGISLPAKRVMSDDNKLLHSNSRVRQHTKPLLLSKKVAPNDTHPPHPKKSVRQDSRPLPQKKGVSPENKQDMPLRYHSACIVQGIWKWFKELTLIIHIFLALLTLVILSIIVNALIQLAILLLNPAYTFLGIIASAIAIYEFIIKRQQKKP